MSAIVINYPHWRPSFEPKRLRREQIWQVAECARRQTCGPLERPKIMVARMMSRTRQLQVNGVPIDVHWEFKRTLTDESGNPAIGLVTHDERWPNVAMICLDAEAIGERDDLARSTAAHELAHSVFEVPSWIAARGKLHRTDAVPERRYQTAAAAELGKSAKMDWSEWRANEFMGAYLVPLRLLHLHMHKRAAALGVPLAGDDNALPIINGRKACFDSVEELATQLAGIFGVSISCIHMRLRKYCLISAA